MTLQIKIDDEDLCKLIVTDFEEDESDFLLKGSSKNYGDVMAKIHYPLKVDNRYKKNEYDIYLFFNNDFAENDIYQVYENDHDIRIGWVFPLQALLSNKHNYADNEHFLPYAYVAFEKLLSEDKTNFIDIPAFNQTGSYTLGDFYKEDETIVMILCNRKTKNIDGFDICNYLPYLYSKGYYYAAGNYGIPLFKSDTRLNIKSISDNVKNDSFITQLFKELLVYEKHHLVKFYLLYQVIELLIEKVFNKELTQILFDLSSQTKSLFQVKEDLGNIAKEKERIKKLFFIYTKNEGSKSLLMGLCNSLLQNVGSDTKSNAAEALYSVRNLFVHEYRSIAPTELPLIEKINDSFEDLIIEILYEVKDIS